MTEEQIRDRVQMAFIILGVSFVASNIALPDNPNMVIIVTVIVFILLYRRALMYMRLYDEEQERRSNNHLSQ